MTKEQVVKIVGERINKHDEFIKIGFNIGLVALIDKEERYAVVNSDRVESIMLTKKELSIKCNTNNVEDPEIEEIALLKAGDNEILEETTLNTPDAFFRIIYKKDRK